MTTQLQLIFSLVKQAQHALADVPRMMTTDASNKARRALEQAVKNIEFSGLDPDGPSAAPAAGDQLDQVPKAGQELDRLIVEKVMGWQIIERNQIDTAIERAFFPVCFLTEEPTGVVVLHETSWREKWNPWRPSTNIAHAWEVVEKLGLSVARYTDYDEDGTFGWMAGDLSGEFMHTGGCIDGTMRPSAFAITAPLAICLAALRKVGALKEER